MTDPWYKNGLKFGCTQCGQCCTGSPGYVWVNLEEIQQMSDHLQIPMHEFISKYTRKVGHRLALLEDSKTYDCVFLKGNKCQIYSLRPKQCRTFPWWPEHLNNKEEWDEAANRCEGINHPDAPIVSLDEIEKHIK